MSTKTLKPDAAASGTITLGGDLTIHRMGFGAMRLTGDWGAPEGLASANRLLRHLGKLGINFIDTADCYGPEINELIIGEALPHFPKDMIVSTKGGLIRGGPQWFQSDGRPEYLRQCVELSLRRLRVDHFDLYQLHRIDKKVPVEDTLRALKEFQKAGKIRHIGLSEVSVAEIEQAQKVVPIVSVQNRYNFGDRKSDDVLNYCEKHGLGFIAWFPMASGELTKPGGKLDQAAQSHGVTVGQLALAWLLHRSPAIIPIPGTSSIAHLEENTAASSLRLTDDEWKEIEKAYN